MPNGFGPIHGEYFTIPMVAHLETAIMSAMADMIEAREPTAEGDDPLAWLGNNKEEILRKVNMGYRFFQAEVSLPNGVTSKIAFCGEARHSDEATDHTIYIERPEILNDFKRLRYDKRRKAWLVEDETNIISLEEHEGVYFLKENGAKVRSDVTGGTLEALIMLQKRSNGAEVAWLAPEVNWVEGLNDIFAALAEHEESKRAERSPSD